MMKRTAAALLAAMLAGCSTLPGWMLLQGRAAITDYRHFDNAPIARAAEPSPLPSAPMALRWPDGLDDAAAEVDLAQRGRRNSSSSGCGSRSAPSTTRAEAWTAPPAAWRAASAA